MPRAPQANDQPKRELVLPFVPSCVAVDRSGDEFVGGFSNGYVAVYAPGAKGNAKVLQRIALPDRHPDVNGVAVDASGEMFVSDSNEVSQFMTPVTNPTLARAIVGTGQQNSPIGMAPNTNSGELCAVAAASRYGIVPGATQWRCPRPVAAARQSTGIIHHSPNAYMLPSPEPT
jgi:hypothetical protein